MIDELIERAKQLRGGDRKSPLIDVWKIDVESYLSERHGEEFVKVFRNTLRPSAVFTTRDDFQAKFVERMDKAIELLEGLRDRPEKEPPSPPKPRDPIGFHQ